MADEDRKTILVKKEDLHDRRLQKILDKHEGEPFIPMGEMMVAHLEFVREKDRQNEQDDAGDNNAEVKTEK